MAIKTQAKTRNQIDVLLNKADKALTGTSYFECEELCIEAVERAMKHRHYDQVAQAVMPLMEARRQKRVAAIDSGCLSIIDGELPHPPDIKPGVYLVQPPRVGIDGKRLRDAADKERVPIVVLVREPTTQTKLVPVVAISHRTVRTKVALYDEVSVEWILEAIEELGEVVVELIDTRQEAAQRVEYLWTCVQTLPDHEGLPALLAQAATEATREAIEEKATPNEVGAEPILKAVDDLAVDVVDDAVGVIDDADEDEDEDEPVF
jgi:hypothetical protein